MALIFPVFSHASEQVSGVTLREINAETVSLFLKIGETRSKLIRVLNINQQNVWKLKYCIICTLITFFLSFHSTVKAWQTKLEFKSEHYYRSNFCDFEQLMSKFWS